jgi:hypothetical protein
MIKFLGILFRKKLKKTQDVDLLRWNEMENIHSSLVRGMLRYNNFNDIAVALIYSNDKIVEHILNCCDDVTYNEVIVKDVLINYIKKHKNINKSQSDKMKRHILNNIPLNDQEDFSRPHLVNGHNRDEINQIIPVHY